jgi:hypothetical protein
MTGALSEAVVAVSPFKPTMVNRSFIAEKVEKMGTERISGVRF